MKSFWKLGSSAILLPALLFMISGVARSEEAPTIPAGSIAFVAKATENRDCLEVYSAANGSSTVVGCLKRCKKITLTGNSNDTWLEISAPLSGWVNGLFLDPNPRICKSGSYAGIAPYDTEDPSENPDDYFNWWSSPRYGWYSHWWWHHRHNPHHFFAHHHRGTHHGHYHAWHHHAGHAGHHHHAHAAAHHGGRHR